MPWTTHINTNLKRFGLSSCGTTNNALISHGFTDTYANWDSLPSEIYNGTNWTFTSYTINPKNYGTLVGSHLNALHFGGQCDWSYTLDVEKWNGSSWSTTNQNLSCAQFTNCGVGTVNNALSLEDTDSNNSSTYCELWNSVSWTTTAKPTDNIYKQHRSMFGDTSLALSFGGYNQENNTNTSYRWTGSQWQTTTSLIDSYRTGCSGVGDFYNGFKINGSSTTDWNLANINCNKWDSTTWVTTDNNINSSAVQSSCGSYTSAFSINGANSIDWYNYTTQKWNGVTVPPQPTGISATDGIYTNRVVITWSSVSTATKYKVSRELIN